MSEKTRQDKLAAAKKKLKEYQQRNSPGVPAGAKTKKKKTGSSPETATSGGCHSPEDSSSNSSSLYAPQSQYQELAVALDSNSTTINHLNENIESLVREKKANNEIHKAQMEQLETINILMLEKADLKTTLYHTKRAARHFEEESKDLASRLQYSLQHTQELEWALSAVPTQQQEEDRSSSHSEAVLQQQLQQSTKERALLTQVTESLKQVQLERDEYAQRITGERARWQERMWKMSVEACTLKEEKRDIHRIQELERSLSELKPQMAEPLSPAPPAGTSEVKQLQDEARHLRKEVESLEGKLQSQVENNQALSLLSKEQKESFRDQEERLQKQQERLREQGERLRKQEERLRKEEESALQLEQQVKELQEKLGEVKETVTSAPSKKGWEVGTSLWGGESGFMDLPKEKADGKEQVEKLELGFIQLSEATDGMSELETRERQGDSSVAAEHVQVNMLELPKLVLPLMGDHEGHGKFFATPQNPADEPAPGAPAPEELGAAGKQGDFYEVSLDNSVEPAPGEARNGSPHDNPTAEQIVHLLPVMQDTQEHPGLATKPCMPFFYRASENREINIIII
uniref:Golgin subfamily A conserved domain-containing protein n=1 Tax=Theropithecus gelada TaxID=9565 RepID=A0A8D2EB62_THEGE